MDYDDIIIGAGSSGAVLAARLSEDPWRRVLLLEAGPDYATLAETPKDLLGPDASLRDHDWRLRSRTLDQNVIPFPRGKVMGGSSAVNGAVALRGESEDYDEWAQLGNPEWSWHRVLPYFKRLEDDELGPSDLHGVGGPIPVRRTHLEHFCPSQRAAYEACLQMGFAAVSDLNGEHASGVGPIPLNNRDRVRISTALGYLLPARKRSNLRIVGGCLVDRVLFEGGKAVGVQLAQEGSANTGKVIRGKRVTLSAGAIHTPALLVRSGLGPRQALAVLGVDCIVDAPGVGTRLVDHAAVGMYAVPKVEEPDTDPNHQMIVRFTAEGSSERNDMQLYLFGRVPLKAGPLREAAGTDKPYMASASLMRPQSVGALRIASRDPCVAPIIELNFLEHPEDRRRLVAGARLCWQLLHTSPLAERVARVPFWSDDVLSSDERAARAIRSSVGSAYHPVSTARMGPEGDPNAVVDQYCQVRGVQGLRVVDASVMPTVPRANTNFPCMMIGERVADWMRQE